MPILRLVAEGVGPFEKLDLDLSDGKGNPHLGPHILAGVNGAGKSTVLKTIAWVLDETQKGFDLGDWQHSLTGHEVSRALLVVEDVYARSDVQSAGSIRTRAGLKELAAWVESCGVGHLATLNTAILAGVPFSPEPPPAILRFLSTGGPIPLVWLGRGDVERSLSAPSSLLGSVAAYTPSRRLKYLANPDLTKSPSSAFENALAFGDTVQNELVQSWLVGLHSKQAIALQMNQPAEEYSQALARFESALRLIYEDRFRVVPQLKPGLHPRLQVGNQSLNFSQVADGIRCTIGWLSDFMMRQDLMQWDARLKGKRPGVLLLDEVDAHLHPQWQRTLLPAMREALPDVQIIVTSHSPFVISSCPGSRVHVLDIDQYGRASLKQSRDAPVGDDVMTTLDGIFGIESRFDVETERELDEWNELKKMEVVGRLDSEGAERLSNLSQGLSRRSELLKSIVGDPVPLPLKRKPSAGHNGKAKPVARKARAR